MTNRERASLEQRWRAYQELTQTRNHWYWRPGWNPSRRFLTWHLTFADQPALHDLVRQIQKHLNLPEVDLVPLGGLHLTMQGLGFVDELPEEHVEAVVARVKDAASQVGQFSLELGPVDPDEQGVGLLVSPWTPVERIRLSVRRSIASVMGDVSEKEEGFRPHVTVAYSSRDADPTRLRDRLSRLRELQPASADIRHLQLIELRREGHRYAWDVRATASLAT